MRSLLLFLTMTSGWMVAPAQSPLPQQIATVATAAKGQVSVACSLPGVRLECGYHAEGSSGVEKGMAAATNDVGLITLPDGRRLAVAIFVTDALADSDTIEATIAGIAKAIYDEAVAKSSK